MRAFSEKDERENMELPSELCAAPPWDTVTHCVVLSFTLTSSASEPTTGCGVRGAWVATFLKESIQTGGSTARYAGTMLTDVSVCVCVCVLLLYLEQHGVKGKHSEEIRCTCDAVCVGANCHTYKPTQTQAGKISI